MSEPLDLDAIRARAEAAHAEVHGLCDGSRQWTMRVPAEEARDSDLVISASLDDVDRLCSFAETSRSLVAELLARIAELEKGDRYAASIEASEREP